jgi:hypothetical protein
LVAMQSIAVHMPAQGGDAAEQPHSFSSYCSNFANAAACIVEHCESQLAPPELEPELEPEPELELELEVEPELLAPLEPLEPELAPLLLVPLELPLASGLPPPPDDPLLHANAALRERRRAAARRALRMRSICPGHHDGASAFYDRSAAIGVTSTDADSSRRKNPA